MVQASSSVTGSCPFSLTHVPFLSCPLNVLNPGVVKMTIGKWPSLLWRFPLPDLKIITSRSFGIDLLEEGTMKFLQDLFNLRLMVLIVVICAIMYLSKRELLQVLGI